MLETPLDVFSVSSSLLTDGGNGSSLDTCQDREIDRAESGYLAHATPPDENLCYFFH